ncbi:hypothetical protein [Sphingomonas sp. LHG3406-1]|uniref:hypothetical protein n=1 Tax=Sphingomonas sp. LHG3406-1 TaxID=2804617 RepID=UPI00261A0FB1|nr:hypothetical protein [Sphingomonas sp. LHG3406-1]
MRVASCFRTLGIEPTDDRKAIRRAYAAKLKAMDIEADPQGYEGLREARDVALRHADGFGEPSDEVYVGSLEAAEAQPSVAADADTMVMEPAAEEASADAALFEDLRLALSQDTSAIAALLAEAREQQRPLAEEEQQAIADHWNRLVDNPLLGHVGMLAQGSEIFAEVIAESMPQSDMLIEPAATFFGWSGEDELTAEPALAAVLERRRDLAMARALDEPSHRLHKAWNELREPASEHSRKGWFVGQDKVDELLTLVRTRHPTLEHHFDSWRVSLWEVRDTGAKRTGFFAVWMVLIALNVWHRSCETEPSRSSSAPPAVVYSSLGTLEQEWRALLSNWGDDTFVSLARSRNDRLFDYVAAEHARAKTNGETSADFQARMRERLSRQVDADWTTAPLPLLRDRVELQQETLAELKARPAECEAFLQGRSFIGQRTYAERLRVVESELIFALDPKRELALREEGTRRFSIPGQLVEDARKRADLSLSQMENALKLTGPADTMCAGREAFLSVLLEAVPAVANPVLRDMAKN